MSVQGHISSSVHRLSRSNSPTHCVGSGTPASQPKVTSIPVQRDIYPTLRNRPSPFKETAVPVQGLTCLCARTHSCQGHINVKSRTHRFLLRENWPNDAPRRVNRPNDAPRRVNRPNDAPRRVNRPNDAPRRVNRPNEAPRRVNRPNEAPRRVMHHAG